MILKIDREPLRDTLINNQPPTMRSEHLLLLHLANVFDGFLPTTDTIKTTSKGMHGMWKETNGDWESRWDG